MGYDISLPPKSETTFPCTKVSGEPTKVTFVHKAADGTIVNEWEFVLVFDDPVPEVAVPVAFNNTDKKQTMTVVARNNVQGAELSVKKKEINDYVSMLEFGKEDAEVLIFSCKYRK